MCRSSKSLSKRIFFIIFCIVVDILMDGKKIKSPCSEKGKQTNFPLTICAEIFEKILFKYLYNHLVSENLITNKQSGFRPGDSTTNQLIDLVNEIFKSFDHRNSYENLAIFLYILNAFDKVWQEGNNRLF